MDGARTRWVWLAFPPISAKGAEMDGARMRGVGLAFPPISQKARNGWGTDAMGVACFPTHFRKKRGNGWGTATVFKGRLNRRWPEVCVASLFLGHRPSGFRQGQEGEIRTGETAFR